MLYIHMINLKLSCSNDKIVVIIIMIININKFVYKLANGDV